MYEYIYVYMHVHKKFKLLLSTPVYEAMHQVPPQAILYISKSKHNSSCHPALRKGSLSYTSDGHQGLPVAASIHLLHLYTLLHLRKPLPLRPEMIEQLVNL